MWMYLIVVALVVVGLAGGAFAGGIFTIVLMPLAVIVLVASIAYRGMGHAAERKSGGSGEPDPLPHNSPSQPGHVRTSPERLVDARRAQQ